MHIIKPLPLFGEHVSLEPLNESHREILRTIAQDEKIWTYMITRGFGEKFDLWFDKALLAMEAGEQLPYIVRHIVDQQVIGTTRYYDITPQHARLAIGYTWYISETWGTAVNPECKYLLLKNAFEKLNFNRVEFVTDARNSHSRSAIKKLGATEEGLLRQHLVLEDGYIRDSLIFSIIKPDWPEVKKMLEDRLQMFKMNG